MYIPCELVSKIMLFHSNLPFDKEELIQFVDKWSLVKYLCNQDCPSQEDWNIVDQLRTNRLIRRFYTRLRILR